MDRKEIKFFITTIGKKQQFIVIEKGQILEKDWSKLEETESTNLTLITCVENQPTKRLYIRASLIK